MATYTAAWEILTNCVTLTTARSTKYPAVAQRWLRATGGWWGVNVRTNSLPNHDVRVSRCEVTGCNDGVVIDSGVTLENCLVYSNSNNAVTVSGVSTLSNCTVCGAGGKRAVYLEGGPATLRNNVIWADGSGTVAIYVDSATLAPASDYNCIYTSNSALVGTLFTGNVPYATLGDWRAAFNTDQHSMAADPGSSAPPAISTSGAAPAATTTVRGRPTPWIAPRSTPAWATRATR